PGGRRATRCPHTSRSSPMPISFATAVNRPRSTNGQLVGVPVFAGGPVGRGGASRRDLEALGFTGKLGTTLATPGYVYVGVGDRSAVSPALLRPAAAAMARAASKVPVLVTSLADVDGVDRRTAAQAVAEGVLLGAYRYVRLKRDATLPALERV